ncbi:MAG: hypothetical protein L3J70_08735 [Gammaproteobacteria bacterium]|nr:hypothetical protein [Gammaproteobacteria bacterium]
MGNFSNTNRWSFLRLGGFDQVQLKDGNDLASLDKLDQKLWAALSCPTRGIEFDENTLDLIDTDGDGHIRAPEILAAVQWAVSVLKNPDDLLNNREELPLSAINTETEEGEKLLQSAKQILSNLGKADAESITAEDTSNTEEIFAGTHFNGDGIIPVEAATEEKIQTVIQNIIDCLEAEKDLSGADGISQEKTDLFFESAQAFSDWWKVAEEDAKNILPFGDKTAAAATTFEKIKNKVDDYFTRSQLAQFDETATSPLNPAQSKYESLAEIDLQASMEEIAGLPLARIKINSPLPLKEGVNPAWANTVTQLNSDIIAPLFGEKSHLSFDEWQTISGKFSAYESWEKEKKGAEVESLGIERIREILSSNAQVAINSLIATDNELKPESDSIASVDRLVRYHRDLSVLLRNYVSFADFYNPDKKAIFQAGTLYLDGRSCDLCVHVEDIAKHSAMASSSRVYIAYCECTRPGSDEKMTIAAAFTDGDSDHLMVGRNGIFYDRDNKDWDATIVKLIEQPISIRQAFWSPYKRVAKMIGSQIEKMASSRDKAIDSKAASGITDTAAGAGKAPAAFDIGKFAGIFAAIGLALGALAAALAAVLSGFLGLSWWQMPLALIGVMLLISGPSMLLAWLKLRQRNLAPILDANGWAVNTRAKLNIPFGKSLTKVAELPAGAKRSMKDPFAEKKRPWKTLIVIFALLGGGGTVLWQNGTLQEWLKPIAPSWVEKIGGQTDDAQSIEGESTEIVQPAETPLIEAPESGSEIEIPADSQQSDEIKPTP